MAADANGLLALVDFDLRHAGLVQQLDEFLYLADVHIVNRLILIGTLETFHHGPHGKFVTFRAESRNNAHSDV